MPVLAPPPHGAMVWGLGLGGKPAASGHPPPRASLSELTAMLEKSIPPAASSSSSNEGGPAPAPPSPPGAAPSPAAASQPEAITRRLAERGKEMEKLIWGWEGASDGPGRLRAAPAPEGGGVHGIAPPAGRREPGAGETRAERVGRGKKPTGSVSLAILYSNQLARRDPALPCAHP